MRRVGLYVRLYARHPKVEANLQVNVEADLQVRLLLPGLRDITLGTYAQPFPAVRIRRCDAVSRADTYYMDQSCKRHSDRDDCAEDGRV